MIEVEVRGRLKNFEKTFKEFRKKARFIEEKDRFSLVYFRHDLNKDVREMKEDRVDLRLRVTNKKAELIMKYGLWGGSDKREEISIPISLGKFGDMVELLKLIGWDKGVCIATRTWVFNYNGIEFVLVKNKDYDYFEAEKMVDGEEDGAMEQIKKECKTLGLRIFEEEEFIEMINSINHGENQFDFKKQEWKEIKKKYEDYF